MQNRSELSQLLQQELICLKRLWALLQEEKDALGVGDIDAIERITSAKTAALQEESSLIERRSKLLSDASLEDSAAGLHDLIDRCNDAVELRKNLERISELSTECYEQNRQNGRLISQRQQTTSGALNVLRQADQTSRTYSDVGEAAKGDQTRTLGKA